MIALKKIAFVLDEFALGAPAQQLLDRFLLGYPRDGEFHHLEGSTIHVYSPHGNSQELERRSKEHGLVVAPDRAAAVSEANAVAIVPRAGAMALDEKAVAETLQHAPRGSRCFIHGVVASRVQMARQLLLRAEVRGIEVRSGTSVGVTWRLPEIEVPPNSIIREALIVVQGAPFLAELEALDGVFPLIDLRQNKQEGLRSLRSLRGDDVWRGGADGNWSWSLLTAALSRSDTPQGDPVRDGRTQDLAGLGLVPKLAHDPRGWAIQFDDGLKLTVLVLDGVVADYNCALALGDGRILSTQLFRPPKPAQHQFSRLAAVMEDFFRTGAAPWPVDRNMRTVELLEKLSDMKGGDKKAQSP